MDYQSFLSRKQLYAESYGFDVDPSDVNRHAFDWQRVIVPWSLKRGRAALFLDCGLGKTLLQLDWGRLIHEHTGGDVLILCPLAVQWQTRREAAKFGISDRVQVNVCDSQESVKPGITITNYEKLHLFDPSHFMAVALDESSILKAYTGATKRRLCEAFAETRFKLACTATPAPNDRMELGNHSEFLGIMPSNDMLARWFINDGGKAGNYRLRRHGERDFWRWVASWACCLSSPSDLGYDGSDFQLPPLVTHEHVIECRPQDGYLFAVPRDVSATDVHKEKRAYLEERADCVAELALSNRDSWAIWVDTDYEADAVAKRLPEAVEVRGSHNDRHKEAGLQGFADGTHRVIITKPEIGGFGLNWQHCHNTTWFAGYSYERFYQAIRRLWRFGQRHAVQCHVVRTVNEGSIVETIERKKREHVEMQLEMASLMHDGMIEELGIGLNRPRKYEAEMKGSVPQWLTSKTACLL